MERMLRSAIRNAFLVEPVDVIRAEAENRARQGQDFAADCLRELADEIDTENEIDTRR